MGRHCMVNQIFKLKRSQIISNKSKSQTHLNVTQETNEKTNQIHMKNKQPKKCFKERKQNLLEILYKRKLKLTIAKKEKKTHICMRKKPKDFFYFKINKKEIKSNLEITLPNVMNV